MLIPAGASGVDYSTARPGGKVIAAAGGTFANRYVTETVGGLKKALTVSEIDDLHANGIAIVANGETTETQMLLTTRAVSYCRGWISAMQRLKFPPGSVLVISHDTSQINDQVVPSFRACGELLKANDYRLGAYGDGQVLTAIAATDIECDIYWATMSWGWPGGVYPLATIRQGKGNAHVVGCDPNLALKPFYGWLPGTPNSADIGPSLPTSPQIPIPLSTQGDNMFVIWTRDKLGIHLIDFRLNTITHLGDAAAVIECGFPSNQAAPNVGQETLNWLYSYFNGLPPVAPASPPGDLPHPLILTLSGTAVPAS